MRLGRFAVVICAGTVLAASGTPARAVASAYDCTVRAVHENRDGPLAPRPAPDRAVGARLSVDATTGVVIGFYGTDGWTVEVVRRPPGDGMLTVERAYGIEGDGANHLRIAPSRGGAEPFVFTYVKNWLYVSGTCRLG